MGIIGFLEEGDGDWLSWVIGYLVFLDEGGLGHQRYPKVVRSLGEFISWLS